MFERFKITILTGVVFTALLAGRLYAQVYSCGQDLNNNGDLAQQGETAACITTLQGQLCPISSTTCSMNLDCPLGSQYACDNNKSCSTGVCSVVTVTATCPSGALNPVTNICETTEYRCDLTNTHYPTRTECAAACGQTTTCRQNYSCPLGSQYACMNNSGNEQCSPNTCYDISLISGTTNSTADTSSYSNNGAIDQNTGACQGFIYIFNGKGAQCRPSGYDTTYFNCCSYASGGTLEFLRHCRQSEADTVSAMYAKRCHYVGDYCVKRWKYIGCVQKARTSCCFNSMLARIIQEQGRPQLKKFAPDGNWGTAVAPNCIGFTPDDFQMLDFSKIDLSEYIGTISRNISSQMQQNIGNSIRNFYNNIKP